MAFLHLQWLSCVDSVVSKDPSKIEEAVYPDESKFLNLLPLSFPTVNIV